MVQGDLSPVYTITFWSEHGLRLERCHFFSARHCTFTLIFLPCLFKNRLRTEHECSTGAIFTAHTDFFHGPARLSVYTFVKAVTARLIVVPRPTYLVVLVTAKNLVFKPIKQAYRIYFQPYSNDFHTGIVQTELDSQTDIVLCRLHFVPALCTVHGVLLLVYKTVAREIIVGWDLGGN